MVFWGDGGLTREMHSDHFAKITSRIIICLFTSWNLLFFHLLCDNAAEEVQENMRAASHGRWNSNIHLSLRNNSPGRVLHLSTLITCIDLTEHGGFPVEWVQQTGNTLAADATAEDHGPSRPDQTNRFSRGEINLPSADMQGQQHHTLIFIMRWIIWGHIPFFSSNSVNYFFKFTR